MDLTMAPGAINPITRNEQVQVSHLLFVDNMLVFCHADKKSVEHIKTPTGRTLSSQDWFRY